MSKSLIKNLVAGAGVLTTLAAGLSTPTRAGYWSGNDLLAKCQGGLGTAEYSLCLGYVEGVADSLDWLGFVDANGHFGCVPVGVTAGQLKDVLIKALNDDPANRNIDGYVLTEVAFVKAWNCRVAAPKHK